MDTKEQTQETSEAQVTSEAQIETVTQPPNESKPKIKNPKKVEAGKKGAMIKNLKKEQREKEQVERVTYKEPEFENKEKPVKIQSEKNTKVEKHGNVINYGLIGLVIIGVGYIGYQKYNTIKTETIKNQDTKRKYDNLDMK